MAAVLQSIARTYSASVAKRPLLTNACLGFGIAGVGDIICQRLMEGKEHIDWKRTADMAIIRFAVMAPFLHVYFPFLARTVPGNTFPRVLSRVALDQMIGSPVSITLTFGAAALLQGRLETLPQRLQEQLPVTWQTGASYWPFVHTLNFKFVPVAHQAIVAHVASVWWNAVLSYRANTQLGQQGQEQGKAGVSGESQAEAGQRHGEEQVEGAALPAVAVAVVPLSAPAAVTPNEAPR